MMTAGQPAVSSLPANELPAYQAARRQRIVDAARSMLEAQPYEQIQIRDVAATAGVALGTLYRYFSSKEHLYAAVLLAWGTGFEGRGDAGAGPLRRLEARTRGALTAFERRPQFFRLLVLLLSSSDPNATALMDTFRQSLEGTILADLKELDPDAADDYAVLVWGTINHLLTRSIFHEVPMTEAYRVNDRLMGLLRARFDDQSD
jgi:TetR/AcrR family transcriptional regulator, cholesterol catabolism regulator